MRPFVSLRVTHTNMALIGRCPVPLRFFLIPEGILKVAMSSSFEVFFNLEGILEVAVFQFTVFIFGYRHPEPQLIKVKDSLQNKTLRLSQGDAYKHGFDKKVSSSFEVFFQPRRYFGSSGVQFTVFIFG